MSVRKILEKLDGIGVLHFSVFIENKVGALLKIVKLLNEHSVDVLAISLLDSSESGITRIIVSDPDRVKYLFDKHDIAYTTSEVLLVELPQSSSDLAHILSSLLMAEVNISFAYPLLIRPRGKSVLAIHPDDMECASSVLMGQHFTLLNQSDISR
jgi:hypothetical protein